MRRYFLFALALTAVLTSARAGEENLLTNNPSFEAPGKYVFHHGDFSLPGWQGKNRLFGTNGVADADAPDGQRRFYIEWGGTLATAEGDRPDARPGCVYELRYDLRTAVCNDPKAWGGTLSFLDFYDASGKRLKRYWGPDWLPAAQPQGTHPWETISVRGVAPAGASRLSVCVELPPGRYPRTKNRKIELDHFRVVRIDEKKDALALRRFPRLIEPGKPATLAIHHAATAPRTLAVRLLDQKGNLRAEETKAVEAGRGFSEVTVPIPSNLPRGGYSWEICLQTAGPAAKRNIADLRESGVFLDETVSTPPENNGVFDADHPNIVRMGRWDDADPKHPWMLWYASEIRLRFNGTRLALRASAGPNGYGGPRAARLYAVIDGDEAHLQTIRVDRFNSTFSLCENLPDRVHTARIFKAAETTERLRFDGFQLDPGRGLLRPEPLPHRRIEIYGDSVTSGGSASPTYFGYAPMLGRVLDADIHVISKGGTGVASSFSKMVTLPHYWDLLTFSNPANVSRESEWDFSRWTPDAVVIAIGHNDQFNGGAPIFAERYREFVQSVRKVYPKTPILCVNTVISAPAAHFQKAVMPLLATDKNVAFAFQWTPWIDPKTAHPPTPAHAAMVLGDEARFSLAEELEDLLGWGLDGAGSRAK